MDYFHFFSNTSTLSQINSYLILQILAATTCGWLQLAVASRLSCRSSKIHHVTIASVITYIHVSLFFPTHTRNNIQYPKPVLLEYSHYIRKFHCSNTPTFKYANLYVRLVFYTNRLKQRIVSQTDACDVHNFTDCRSRVSL